MRSEYYDLSEVAKFESRGSTIHTHYDGREIQRTFYLKPAAAAPVVVGTLLGTVWESESAEGAQPLPALATRYFPARDPDYPDCFCNEVKVCDVDPRAISFSETLALNFPALADLDPEASRLSQSERKFSKFMDALSSVPDTPAGGCFLTASYRPLITGWRADETTFRSATDQQFDWMQPHFTPTVRTVPWPDGFQVASGGGVTSPLTPAVPDEVAQPVNIPVIEFTVKRLFVNRPRFNLLNSLMNTVNTSWWPDPWPKTSDGWYEGIPQFPPETLRFDSYEVIEHASPWPASLVWYELIYHFSWISLADNPVYNDQGELAGGHGHAWVSWNHVFMRPATPYLGGYVYDDLGWWYVARMERTKWRTSPVFEIPMEVGPLFARATFDLLFMLNPPVAP